MRSLIPGDRRLGGLREPPKGQRRSCLPRSPGSLVARVGIVPAPLLFGSDPIAHATDHLALEPTGESVCRYARKPSPVGCARASSHSACSLAVGTSPVPITAHSEWSPGARQAVRRASALTTSDS